MGSNVTQKFQEYMDPEMCLCLENTESPPDGAMGSLERFFRCSNPTRPEVWKAEGLNGLKTRRGRTGWNKSCILRKGKSSVQVGRREERK